ncbi:MAG: hypothetical protein HY718_04115 [Planctomycetes bacterium]|nr:hypothetical protein [Planctomycetota bacterium]
MSDKRPYSPRRLAGLKRGGIQEHLGGAKGGRYRLRRLLQRNVKPDDLPKKASKVANKAWAVRNAFVDPLDIDLSGCPSYEAWGLLIATALNPETLFDDYKKVSVSKDDLERERRMMDTSEIERHLDLALKDFEERLARGEPVN